MRDVVIRLFKFCCSFALFHCESQAHTNAVAATIQDTDVVTFRYAAVISAVVPSTTTQHSVSTTLGTGRIGFRAAAIIRVAITVMATLP